MAQRDFKNNVQVVHLGNLTLSGATPAASDWVDTRGFDTCTLVAVANTVTDAGTAAGFSFEVQESDLTTDVSATAVADDELVGLESALTLTSDTADDSVPGFIGYVGNARYVRLEATGTTGTAADVTVVALLTMGAHGTADAGVGTSVAAT